MMHNLSSLNLSIIVLFSVSDDDHHYISYQSGTVALKEPNTLPIKALTRSYLVFNRIGNKIILLLNIALTLASTFPVRAIGHLVYPILFPIRVIGKIFRMITFPVRLLLKPIKLIRAILSNLWAPISFFLNKLLLVIKPKHTHLFPKMPEVTFYF